MKSDQYKFKHSIDLPNWDKLVVSINHFDVNEMITNI